MYAQIAVAMKACAATDRERTEDILDQYVPLSWQPSYTRFITGEIIDNTLPAVRDELRELHSDVSLVGIDTVLHGRKGIGSRYAPEPIIVTGYVCVKDEKLQFQRWERFESTYLGLAEFRHDIYTREQSGLKVLASVGKRRIAGAQSLEVSGKARDLRSSTIESTKPEIGL